MWDSIGNGRLQQTWLLIGVGLAVITVPGSAQTTSATSPSPSGPVLTQAPSSPIAGAQLSHATGGGSAVSRLASPSAISALNLGRYRSGILNGAPASQAPLLLRPQYLIASRSGLSPLRSSGPIPPPSRTSRGAQAASSPQAALAPQAAPPDGASPDAPKITPILYARAMVARGVAGASRSAWVHYQQAEYREAWLSYESVLAVYPGDIRSRLGQVLCELLRGRYEPALVHLDRLRPAAPGGLFAPQFPSEFGLRDRAEFDRHRRALSAWTGARPDASLALSALFLWINGETAEAVALTDQIRQRYPDSPYAAFGDAMRPADDARPG